ncbi:MAG: restriction endonuclease subunit S [Pyrinomonadaceae bacterium]
MQKLKDTIGDKGLLTDGDWILSENLDNGGSVGVIQLKHIGVGEFLDKNFSFITEETFKKLKCTEVQQNDVLISRMAEPIARACIVPKLPFKTVTAVDVSILRIDENVADRRYIKFLCNSDLVKTQAEEVSRGTTRQRITRKELEKIQIPLPKPDEQKRIATILDKADRLRRQRRFAQTLSDSFLQSVFIKMFGDPASNPMNWEVLSLRKISAKFSDGPFGSNLKTEHYASSGVPVIRLQNIGVGEYVESHPSFISHLHFKELSKHRCIPGDVIVGTMGEPNLRACILPSSIPEALNKADCVQIRVNEKKANSDFICWLLNMPQTLFLASGMIVGQTRSRISMGRLAELDVPIPPLPLQEKFAEIVQKFERVRRQQREATRQAEHLFQTLLHRAFRGEL